MLSESQKRLRNQILTSKYFNPLVTYKDFSLAMFQHITSTIPNKDIFLYCKCIQDWFGFDIKFIEPE